MIFPPRLMSAATLITIYPNNHVFKGVDGGGAAVTKILLFSAGEKKERKTEDVNKSGSPSGISLPK